MTDNLAPAIKRLYLVSASVQSASTFVVAPGILLAQSAPEAVGLHVQWLQKKFPGSIMGAVDAVEISIETIREAANAQP